jgi:hypothetical protein
MREGHKLDHFPTQQEVVAMADKWRPYRSLATRYPSSAALEWAPAPLAAPHETDEIPLRVAGADGR